MTHKFSIDDDVHHQMQGPQGRDLTAAPEIYTIINRMPIEADGRLRYRIKSKSGNTQRVVTEEQISRPQ